MKSDGMYRRVSPREQERRWIEEAKQVRLAGIKTAEDRARFKADFSRAFVAHCCECGAELPGIPPSRIAKNPERRCSSCFSKKVKGVTLSGGYLRSTKGRREYQHRTIAAESIGRPLLPGEVVHHRKSKTENEPENLHVYANRGVHVLDAGHVGRDSRGRFCRVADEDNVS